MKLLILGDSWQADWNVKHNTYPGWPNLLANEFDVTNIAQAGVSGLPIQVFDQKRLLSCQKIQPGGWW